MRPRIVAVAAGDSAVWAAAGKGVEPRTAASRIPHGFRGLPMQRISMCEETSPNPGWRPMHGRRPEAEPSGKTYTADRLEFSGTKHVAGIGSAKTHLQVNTSARAGARVTRFWGDP